MSGRRVTLVTGAGSGIGEAAALKFAAAGHSVGLLGRTRSRLERTAARIAESSGAETLVIPASQEVEAEAKLAVSMTVEAFGQLDVLFNNAGIFAAGTVRGSSASQWEEMMRINLLGPVFLSQAAIAAMEGSGGVIIHNASTLGLRTVPGYAAYASSKAALVHLTRCIAVEEAERGIRSVAICPGVVDTPIHGKEGSRREKMEQMAAAHPLGRVGTADEVASLAVYLASDDARWITGSVFTIDGGISL